MITHHVVGIPEDARDEAAAPERRVHAIRDVHVDLDAVVEPRVSVFACLRLQHPRVAHRVAQPVQCVPEPECVGGGAELAVRVQRVLQNRHQQARLPSLVVVLIEEDEKQRERLCGVVRFDALRERGEVAVYHLCERSSVQGAFGRERGKVVDPENMVRASLPDHPQQFPVELQVGDVRESIVIRELGARDSLEQRVELGLLIMFFGEQAVLQRQPHEAGIVPFLCRLTPLDFQDVGQPLEHEQHIFRPSHRDETR